MLRQQGEAKSPEPKRQRLKKPSPESSEKGLL